MGLFGIGDDNRMILDVPVRYAPVLGLPYDPDDDSVWEKSDKKINIVVSKGKGVAKAEGDAIKQLMEYGIPYQAARSMVGAGSKEKPYEILDDSSDPGWEDWRLDELSPEEVAEGRGRTGKLREIDVAPGTEYGQHAPRTASPGTITTPFESQTVTGEQVVRDQVADPFSTAVVGDESKSVADAIADMEVERKRQASAAAQAEAERKAWELRMEQEREAAAEADRLARTQAQIEADQAAARLEAVQNDPRFAAEEGLGGERMIDPLTGQERESAVGGQVTDRGVIGTQAQTLAEVLESQREADRAALAGLGEFTPFDIEQDNTAMGGDMGMGGGTGIKEMLNIFNQDPERYYTTETIIGPDGQAITQQVLSPVAQAALQAFSTQRGAEAMETGARFGAGSPFGVIAGQGGTAQDAIGLAEQQAYSGITSPFAALQTGGGINDISTILRGGLSAQQQSDLAGLQARGGISADEQRQLAGLQARGGLGVEDQFALAGMQARGGLTPEQMQALAGLQARGGLTPQQRYAEQRLAMMPSLLQMSPQSLGGFSEVFGQENLQNYLSPFFTQPDFAAQGAAPAVNWGAQQALPQSMAPAAGTPMEPYVDPNEWGTGGVPVSAGRGGGVPISATAGGNVPIAAGGAQPPVTRQTLGGFQRATPFARGGTEARAAIAGKDLEDYLGEVTPFGGTTRRGGFGSSVSDRFTY
jgi:hypothetical protein